MKHREDILIDALAEYPYNMTPKHIGDFLNLSMNTVYKLITEEELQKVKLGTSNKIIVPKTVFIDWYRQKTW